MHHVIRQMHALYSVIRAPAAHLIAPASRAPGSDSASDSASASDSDSDSDSASDSALG